jgi:hypothetical protein
MLKALPYYLGMAGILILSAAGDPDRFIVTEKLDGRKIEEPDAKPEPDRDRGGDSFVVTDQIKPEPLESSIEIPAGEIHAAIGQFLGLQGGVSGESEREILVKMQPPELGRCGYCEDQKREFGEGWTQADGTRIRVRYVVGGAAAYPQVELPDCPMRKDAAGREIPLFWNFVPRRAFEATLPAYPPTRAPVGTITVGSIKGGKEQFDRVVKALEAVGPCRMEFSWKLTKKPILANNGIGIDIPKEGKAIFQHEPGTLHLWFEPDANLLSKFLGISTHQPVRGIMATRDKLTVELPGILDLAKRLE